MTFSVIRLSPGQSTGRIPWRNPGWPPAPATREAPRPRGLGRCSRHPARGPSLRRVMLSAPITATMTSSDFRPAPRHFTFSAYRLRPLPEHPGQHPRAVNAGAETDLSCSAVGCVIVSLPIRRRVHRCRTSKVFAPSVAFAHALGARLPHGPPVSRGLFNDADTGFLSYEPITCSPPKATLSWRFDSRVSPSAGHQLRGRLAATPAGLSPASPPQLRRTHNA